MKASAVLALAAGDASSGRRSNLYWFRLFVLVHVAVRTFLEIGSQPAGSWYGLNSQLLILCCLGGLLPLYMIWATRIAAALLAVHIGLTMPLTANHVFLEFFCLGLLASLDESEDRERGVLLAALCWLTVIFLFYSGLQKLLYGRYFDGQFLGYVTATEDRFALVFKYLMPVDE